MKKIICIAGKNEIACKSLLFSKYTIQKKFPSFKLFALPNILDKGEDSWQPSFKKMARKIDIECVNIEDIYKLKTLIFISLEHDKIIHTKKFSSKHLYNIHFSFLPKYKGMYTSAWPILNNERYTGVTLHKIDQGIDTGNIIDQIKLRIKTTDCARDLYYKYMKSGCLLFKKNFENLVNNNFTSVRQNILDSSYYSKNSINFKKISINLHKTAYEISKEIRAYSFKEYQLPRLFGKKIVNHEILKKKSKSKPGSIINDNYKSITIATIDYDIKLYFF